MYLTNMCLKLVLKCVYALKKYVLIKIVYFLQYRMHPEISRFPSLYFYDGKLLNGEQMNTKSAEFHDNRNLGPYLFYDVIDGVELHGKNSGSMSLFNEREADAAVQLLRFFKIRYES